MKTVIQRVTQAQVEVDEQVVGEIAHGLLVLVGFVPEDTDEDMDWMIRKILQLRIFNDEAGVMNLSLEDVKGELLMVSQFTLQASTKKGNRPSYIAASKPDVAIKQYENFVQKTKQAYDGKIAEGIFGADMKVSLLNDGPVTIVIDSKNKV